MIIKKWIHLDLEQNRLAFNESNKVVSLQYDTREQLDGVLKTITDSSTLFFGRDIHVSSFYQGVTSLRKGLRKSIDMSTTEMLQSMVNIGAL